MPNEHWIWGFDRVIPSDAQAGRQVLHELLGQLENHHWAKHDVFGVHLAMEEALVNAIRHGNHQDADKRVRICCRLSPERLRIEITDEGQGFDPSSLPDPTDPARLHSPRGRGVMLMRAFMSHIEYNDRGNQVVLEKERGREPPN